jgi:simple sugar transport system permease protein
MRSFLKSKEIWLFAMLMVLVLFISSRSNVFLRAENLLDILKINSVLGIVVLGMTMVIITGGIDVSISAVIATTTMIVGRCIVYLGFNLFFVILISIICGLAFGLVNGLLIGTFKIPAIVATLGTLSVINGTMFLITGGAWVNTKDMPGWFLDFGRITLFGVPIQIYIWVLMIIITWVILKYTLVGRSIYAIGGNPTAAVRAGINLNRTILFVYAYMGILAGIASLVHTSVVFQVDPNAFAGYELQVVAAVVVGGANITGGKGTILGTILGFLFLVILNNGLILAHIPTFWQKVVIGVIILAAVSMDVIQRKNAEKRIPKIDIY